MVTLKLAPIRKIGCITIRSLYNSGRSVQYFSTSQISGLTTRREVKNEQNKTKATPT